MAAIRRRCHRPAALAAGFAVAMLCAGCGAITRPAEPPASPAVGGLSAPLTNSPIVGQGDYVNPLRKPQTP